MCAIVRCGKGTMIITIPGCCLVENVVSGNLGLALARTSGPFKAFIHGRDSIDWTRGVIPRPHIRCRKRSSLEVVMWPDCAKYSVRCEWQRCISKHELTFLGPGKVRIRGPLGLFHQD